MMQSETCCIVVTAAQKPHTRCTSQASQYCSQFMDCGLDCDALEQGIYEGYQFDDMLLILKPLFIHSTADHRPLPALFQSYVKVWKNGRWVMLHHHWKSLGLSVTCSVA